MPSKTRFANEKIRELVDYIRTPHVDRRRTSSTDPYFYGQTGADWRKEQDELHRDIQSRQYSYSELMQELTDPNSWSFSPKEAEMLLKWSQNPENRVSRQVEWGVPQATTSELVMNKILNASGINTSIANKNDPTATDLSRMVGNVREYIDVQNRITYPDEVTGKEMGTIMPILDLNTNVPQNVWIQGSGNDTLLTLKNEMIRQSPNARPGKLFDSASSVERGLTKQSHQKDLIIGGHIDPRSFKVHSKRKGQGPYDPVLPENIFVQDQRILRGNLMGMTKNEFEKEGGSILKQKWNRNSLDLKLPAKMIEELSKPQSPYISREVLEVLNNWDKIT